MEINKVKQIPSISFVRPLGKRTIEILDKMKKMSKGDIIEVADSDVKFNTLYSAFRTAQNRLEGEMNFSYHKRGETIYIERVE